MIREPLDIVSRTGQAYVHVRKRVPEGTPGHAELGTKKTPVVLSRLKSRPGPTAELVSYFCLLA